MMMTSIHLKMSSLGADHEFNAQNESLFFPLETQIFISIVESRCIMLKDQQQ